MLVVLEHVTVDEMDLFEFVTMHFGVEITARFFPEISHLFELTDNTGAEAAADHFTPHAPLMQERATRVSVRFSQLDAVKAGETAKQLYGRNASTSRSLPALQWLGEDHSLLDLGDPRVARLRLLQSR